MQVIKMNLYEIIHENALKTPKKTAIVFKEQRLRYQDIIGLTEKTTTLLLGNGWKKGTHFALLAPNSPEFAILMLAAAKIGAVIVPIPESLKEKALHTAIHRAGCSHIIAPKSFCAQLEKTPELKTDCCLPLELIQNICATPVLPENEPPTIPWPVEPDCDYILTMTSGSTGDPKPIVFTQKTKITRALTATRDVYGLSANDVILVATPMHHSLAQRSTLLPLLMGGIVVILPRFTPATWIKAVNDEKVTFLFAVSNQLEIILNHCSESLPEFPSLKTIVSSSAVLKNESKKRILKAFTCRIDECYGTSEIGVATNISLKDESAPIGSVGKCLKHVRIKITSPVGAPLPAGEKGEVACLTDTRFSRYYNNEEATEKSFDKEGYFYTGDIGMLDGNGWLYYLGRTKDIIITGGINVFPSDIENTLLCVPEIKECAVIGVEDGYFGEAVLAVLVPHKGKKIFLSEVMNYCRQNLTDYQQPLAYEILSALPKNEMGKILKSVLRAQFKDYDATKKYRSFFTKI
jgi:long-chain acyl-CoA synthetase